MNNLKIFLVDDDADDRFFLTEAISAIIKPVEIIELTDGKEFLDVILKQEVDKSAILVVLDMNMPKMNGLEVLETLQFDAYYKNVPVVMVSTSQNETLITEAYRLGVRKYFIKPFTMNEYRKMIMEINDTFIRNLPYNYPIR